MLSQDGESLANEQHAPELETYFEVSQHELDEIYAYHWRASFDDLLRDYEGPFRGIYHELDRFEREGKSWSRIQHLSRRHLIDIELDEGGMIQVVAVPAAEAYRLACEEDARAQAGSLEQTAESQGADS